MDLNTSEPEIEEPRIFLISDTHFGHKNIIRFTDRPYKTVKGMEKSIIHKWNKTIRPMDTVFFLGDFAWEKISYYITHLNGKKFFVTGNHDSRLHHTKEWVTLRYHGIWFLLIHDPAHKPPEWDGWTIHGHVHNKHPFIDRTKKKVNVSVEKIGYRPISIHRIMEIIGLMERFDVDRLNTRLDAARLRERVKAI